MNTESDAHQSKCNSSMSMLFVSVIIPNYNHARFLDERIQSVLNQTYQNFEVIILDDKSTDNSNDVINKYKENPHISHIVLNNENSGSTFKQWQKGFTFAIGDIIWIAESDDSCEKTFLEKLVTEHISNNNVVTFCKSQRIDENSLKYETFHNEIKKGNWDGKDFIRKYLGRYNIIMNASSAIFNKDAALSIDPQYISFKGSGDWLFWIEIVQKGSISYIDEALNHFRKHNTNSTERFYTNGTDYIEDKRIFDYLVKNALISKRTIKSIKKHNLRKFYHYPFDNKEIRKKVLNSWNFSYSEYVCFYFSYTYHNFIPLLKKTILLLVNKADRLLKVLHVPFRRSCG